MRSRILITEKDCFIFRARNKIAPYNADMKLEKLLGLSSDDKNKTDPA